MWLTGSHGLISHAALVERTLLSPARRFVSDTWKPSRPRRRTGDKATRATVMTHIGELIRERYVLGALSTGTHALYESLGWELWRGPTFVDGPRGRRAYS